MGWSSPAGLEKSLSPHNTNLAPKVWLLMVKSLVCTVPRSLYYSNEITTHDPRKNEMDFRRAPYSTNSEALNVEAHSRNISFC